MHKRLVYGIAASLLMTISASTEARRNVNYDEAKVGDYELPALLVSEDGTSVTTPGQWTNTRREQVLEAFRANVYGRTPEIPGTLQFDVVSSRPDALDGLATRKHVRIWLEGQPGWEGMELMLYLPNNARNPVPVFLGLNFYGNHSITDEKDVPLSTRYMRASEPNAIVNHRATEESRGKQAHRWPFKTILERGFAVGTAYCGDLEPDHADGWKDGLRAVLRNPETADERPSDDWGAIGAWAWGLSRMLDYCEQDPQIDSSKAAVIGHSRLGKTALWAGAQDERFATVISNNSGEGGASLARRNYGETIKIITTSFPHWFCPRYSSFAGREAQMPVDQHMLIALVAPRLAYVASATEDRWADPYGEFLSAVHAEPVYELLGLKGLATDEWPKPGVSIGEHVGYHLRDGRHNITPEDWKHYLDFADRHYGTNNTGSNSED